MSEDLAQPIITQPRKAPILTILFTVFLVVLVFVSGFLAYQNFYLQKQIAKLSIQPVPTPVPTIPVDPTANWKTYVNTAYKFSYKYPPETEPKDIITQSEGNRRVLFATSAYETGATQKQNTEYYDGYGFDVVVVEKLPAETISDISYENILNCKDIVELTKSPEKIIISGTAGITYSCRGLGEFTSILLPAPKIDNQYFEIRTFSGGPNKVNYQKTVDQILSTFKFLDSDKISCGGIMGMECPAGYVCRLDGNYPDVGGECVIGERVGEGILKGTVIRSPVCPGAVTEQDPCEAPAANEIFYIINLTGREIMERKVATTDKNGVFTVSLIPATYKLQNSASGIGKDIINPNFTIVAGKTAIQKFNIDTGIR